MSDSEEENIIRYGTPLEPYEEDEVPAKKKFQRETTEQYAVDSHGRRRFHGAFTGGFSAGHGNSVATPEGFTPAAFKSSRSEKRQGSSQRPEDFMDEEDRSEFGIAPRLVQTKSDFSGQKRPHQMRFHDGPIPGEPVLEQMIRAVHETAAVRMLKSMGWRPGQGAGDRVSRKEKRRATTQHKVYGCYVPQEYKTSTQTQSEDEKKDSSSDSEFEYDTLFAPDDYEPYVLRPKSDRFGLGYSGLSRHSVLGSLVSEYGNEHGSSRSHLKMNEKGKKVSIRGQAFGVGALEDEDEDIYATEDMSHYDFTLGPRAETNKKLVRQSSGVLEGFVKASKPMPPVPHYPAPALPRDFKPCAAGNRRSRFEPTDAQPRDQGLGRHELSASARGALLGETPVPKPTPPTEPSEPPATTEPQPDPIAKLLGRNVNFISTAENTEKELDFIPITANKGPTKPVFKPFASNPKKQARYEQFVKDRTVLERDSDVDNISAWERDRELAEFDQAAKLYRPLTGVMGDRFTHAAEPDDQPTNPLAAVSRSKDNRGLATSEQIEAAAAGLYGLMTRAKTEWRPEVLVCKRFNVPDPYTTRPEQKKNEKSKISYSIFEYLESSIHDKESFKKEQSKFSGSKSLLRDNVQRKPNENRMPEKTLVTKNIIPNEPGTSKRMTVAELFLKESEEELKQKESVEVTETINKFDKMELYKSIFLSDSETEEETAKESEKTDYSEFMDKPKNIERNRSPPRGIFANIDFDELNSWNRSNDDKKSTENKTAVEKNEEPVTSVDESNMYGPKIPEKLHKQLQDNATDKVKGVSFKPEFRSKDDRIKTIEIDSTSSSDSWVEEKEIQTKKLKKKKSKKHKSKHKKSKHKKKDR